MFGFSTIKLVAIAIIVLSLIGTVVGVKLRLDHLNSEVVTLTAQNSELTLANKTDETNIIASNDAVIQLQNQEAQRSAAAQTAMQQVKQQSAVKQQQVAQLIAQKATGNKNQDCDLLNQNLNTELGDQQ